MGNSEVDTPTKAPKASTPQEQPAVTSTSPATPVYPDWSTFQAYSTIPPPGFFHSAMASSPPPHPYVWGAQHIIPPYGTPTQYVMYPHGGIYTHPTMAAGPHPYSPYAMPSPNGNAENFGVVPGGEANGKSSECKEKSAIKRSKGSLGSLNMITGKNTEHGKTSGASGNEAYSQSGESGSEASSEGSDANSQNESPRKSGDVQSTIDAITQNGNPVHASTALGCATSQPMLGQAVSIVPMPVPTAAGALNGPATNLNIGMDFWGATNPSPVTPIRGKLAATTVAPAIVPGAPSELWMQDEREMKRQRRKQSNRESARRSRLRKQAECEELAHRVEVLKEENASLRAELNRIKKEYEQLLSHNASLKESLGETPKGIEELTHERNEKPSNDGGHQQNLDPERRGREADERKSC